MRDINTIPSLHRFPVLKWRFEDKIKKSDSCWLWAGSTTGTLNPGILVYGKFQIASRWGALAHRVSYVIYRGQIPKGMCVMHKCDTPLCVNPDHLELGTLQANVDDMVKKGRKKTPVGTKHWNAKLTDGDVRQIFLSSETGPALSERFGVSNNTICKIRRGRLWRHITVPMT